MTAMFEGDPWGAVKDDKTQQGLPAPVVNRIHRYSDLDKSQLSQHHTLGSGHNQAAAGNHVHDGRNSKKLGSDKSLVLLGSKGGNVALANLITMLKNFIEFTDSTT